MLVLILSALPALASQLVAATKSMPEGAYFQHHDWVMACDNTRTCRAAGYASGEDSTLSVLLARDGGSHQPVRGRMSLRPIDGQQSPRGALHLRIKQRDMGILTPAKEEGLYTLSPAQTAALLSALVRDGGITVVDTAGHAWPLSDKGAAAVLLKADDFQGRIGTVGALMRKGTAAESRVPAALPKPAMRKASTQASLPDDQAFAKLATSPALRAALRATLKAPSCEGLLNADRDTPLKNSRLRIQRLDGRHLLASVRCWDAAYNSGDGYWVIREQAPYRATWVTSDASSYGNGEIIASQSDRSEPSCRSERSWTWDGTRFVATSATKSVFCRHALDGTWQLPMQVTDVQ
ncbi:DUF1176 domain-containing protein [Stenotrophomonas sp. B1-1]|uniref:DUF1176 domain-containing protein n=1 Tax=Stenotrophomonas sp. B1-1 TaxID=2710648 RepID=UPI0013DA327C|nr:DUF1176 domain-containing protein [Stenotrophomonas sp. B1-1]